jgi:hypothetical protein
VPLGTAGPALCKCCGQPGANSSYQRSHLIAQTGTANRATGDCRFNRSSLTMSSASLVSVEKSGPDFHRLGLPNPLKSNIRSIPKYGSGVVWLLYRLEQGKSERLVHFVLDRYLSHYPGCFRAGSVASACGHRKACRPTDKLHRRYHDRSGLRLVHYRGSHRLLNSSRGTPSSEPSNPRSAIASACTDS